MSTRSSAPIESLCKVAATLSGLRSLDRVGEVIRDAAHELVGADGTSVLLADGRGWLHPHPGLLLLVRGGEAGTLDVAGDASAAGWALRNRCAVIVPDVRRDPRAPLTLSLAGSSAIVSLAAVPIEAAALASPLGAIEFHFCTRHLVSRQALHRMRALAELVALGLRALQLRSEPEALGARAADPEQHSRLLIAATARLGVEAEAESYRLALTDPLTGLHSQRGLLTLGEALLHQGRSERRPVCVLYAEVQGESELRDRFGEGSCDPMIQAAAQALRLAVPACDLVARLRGGELCAVLRGSSHNSADLVARLSRLCARGGVKTPALRIAVVRDDGDPSTHLDCLIQRAGALLHATKRRSSERMFAADQPTLRLWRGAQPAPVRRPTSRPCAAAS